MGNRVHEGCVKDTRFGHSIEGLSIEETRNRIGKPTVERQKPRVPFRATPACTA